MLSLSAVFKASAVPVASDPPAGFSVRRVDPRELVRIVETVTPSIRYAGATGAQAWGAYAEDGTLVSWCMLSIPSSRPPSHLPSMNGRYWIWHCRTRDEHRGRGLYTAVLRAMVSSVRAADPASDIFVDTSPGNTPAMRAIQRAGFERVGTAMCIRVPRTRLRGAVMLPPGRW